MKMSPAWRVVMMQGTAVPFGGRPMPVAKAGGEAGSPRLLLSPWAAGQVSPACSARSSSAIHCSSWWRSTAPGAGCGWGLTGPAHRLLLGCTVAGFTAGRRCCRAGRRRALRRSQGTGSTTPRPTQTSHTPTAHSPACSTSQTLPAIARGATAHTARARGFSGLVAMLQSTVMIMETEDADHDQQCSG